MTNKLLTLLALAASPLLAAANVDAARERSACAAAHAPKVVVSAANEFQFEYHRGQLRGEARAGADVPCSGEQFASYMAANDPVAMLQNQPTAAGKKQRAPRKAAPQTK